MNTTAPQAPLSNALREVAVIAELGTSSLGLTRTDKNASTQADSQHQAVHGTSRLVVSRLSGADTLHRDIVRCQNEMRANLQTHTTTWGQSARRLMPNSNMEKWLRSHYQLKATFDGLLTKLEQEAEDIIERARQNIGTYAVEPPSKEEMTGAYEVRYNLEPIPEGQFNVGSPEIERFLREQFEKNIQTAYHEAQQDALARLAKPMEAIVERMIAFEERNKKISSGEDPGKVGFFRDTLVTNAAEIAEVFQSFNLTGDNTLNAIASKLDLFLNVKPDDLRKSEELQKAMKQRAADVLAQVNDMLILTPRKGA
jgi:hypothetical protein